MTNVLPENAESQRAWDGVLFDRFLKFRHLIIGGLAPHGAAAIDRCPPYPADRALDIGCGMDTTTQVLAMQVGHQGSELGLALASVFLQDPNRLAAGNAELSVVKHT